MERQRRAPAPLLTWLLVAVTAGCSTVFSAETTGDGGTLGDGGEGPDTGAAGQDGGGSADAAPVVEACTPLGATRQCPANKGIQTCVPAESGGAAWTTPCVPTTCTPSSVPSGALEGCVGAGAFQMGGLDGTVGAGEPDTMPAHRVSMAHRYFVDQFEVTVAELNTWWNGGAPLKPALDKVVYVSGTGDVLRWSSADDAAVTAPGTGLNCTVARTPLEPLASINCVTRATALAYCLARGKRLPTEAEWEFAASGQGAGNDYPWGMNPPTAAEEKHCLLTIDAVCVANLPTPSAFPFPRPAAVDGNTSAALGSLNNLAGNMAEWTLDYAPALGAACTAGTCFPAGDSEPWASVDASAGVVVRGGSYASSVSQVRTRSRAFMTGRTPPDNPSTVGFRCVRTD